MNDGNKSDESAAANVGQIPNGIVHNKVPLCRSFSAVKGTSLPQIVALFSGYALTDSSILTAISKMQFFSSAVMFTVQRHNACWSRLLVISVKCRRINCIDR
jgi:hypothetical protein